MKANTRLLYLGMLYDYGDPQRGLSFEERNFYAPIRRMCDRNEWEISRFDFMDLGRKHGRERMSEMLWETVKRDRPQYLVSILFDPQHDPLNETLRRISFETCRSRNQPISCGVCSATPRRWKRHVANE